MDGQQRVTTLHLLLILIRNLLVDQDALGEARQLETLICSVMYGERRYTIDIAERAPLLDALMNSKTYEIRPGDPPSVRNLWERYGDLDEQFPPDLSGGALPYFTTGCCTASAWSVLRPTTRARLGDIRDHERPGSPAQPGRPA